MASIPPPHPWLPSSSNSSSAAVHLVAVAAAERLGHLLHTRCSASLHILLSSPSLGVCPIDSLPRIKDIWCTRPYLSKRYSLLETLANAFSASCKSCLSLFSGKGSEKRNVDKGKLQRETSKGNPSNERLWTNVLLALFVLVHVGQIATQGRLLLWGAKVNTLIDKGQLWRLVTSSFLHTNIWHLMVNCYSLNSIGATVEQVTGPKRFLTIYFTSALASSLMSYRFCPSPSVGASGAIFGLIGSLAIFILRNSTLVEGGKQELLHIANVLALNMVCGLLFSGIDNWGHFGGLLGGAATSWFLGPVWRYESLSDDGKMVFIDRAPVFRILKKRLS